jgi:hypothetical protein
VEDEYYRLLKRKDILTQKFQDKRHIMRKVIMLYWTSLFLIVPNLMAEIEHLDRPGEYEVKAAFIYNFTRFIEWIPSENARDDSTFLIGVLGDEPFGPVLENTFIGKTIHDHPVRITRTLNLQVLLTCQIIFISESEKSQIEKILSTLDDRQILTIADFPGFAESGGMIELRVEENRVRFVINQKEAAEAGLKINSKLLNLAQKVITK